MPKYKVLGLDSSTKTGWAVLNSDGGVLGFGTESYPRYSEMGRLAAFETWVTSLLDDYAVDLVMLEGYGYANKHTLHVLVSIGAVQRLAIWRRLGQFGEVAPTQLKKFVTGTGSAKKDVMMREVYKRWGFEGKDDEVDAFALAMFGLCAKGLQPPPTKAAGSTVTEWRERNLQLVA